MHMRTLHACNSSTAITRRILFEGERAVGIEYVQNGEKRAARIDAHGEVCTHVCMHIHVYVYKI
jgi:choline dehydrogenase-like flavoprotein